MREGARCPQPLLEKDPNTAPFDPNTYDPDAAPKEPEPAIDPGDADDLHHDAEEDRHTENAHPADTLPNLNAAAASPAAPPRTTSPLTAPSLIAPSLTVPP